jgi:NAD(P)H-dependent FMN reductase
LLLLGICGSSASSRRTRALVETALQGAQTEDGETKIDIVIEEYNSDTQEIMGKIMQADAYLFSSPMYRGSMTGALKNLIDLIPAEYIKGKAAGLVATGGSDHHYLGLDLGFRTAMAFFQVHTIPGVLYQSRFTVEDGKIIEEKVREQAERFGKDIVRLTKITNGVVLGPSLY